MFNDKYGLTDAVLDGKKTMTRRVCKEFRTGGIIYAKDVESIGMYSDENLVEFAMKDGSVMVSVPHYKVGDVVAVAQSYKSVFEESLNYALPRYHWLDDHIDEKGFENKMFVKASEMPHQIQITDVKTERLQDISDEDCLKEGVVYDSRHWVNGYKVENLWNKIDRQSHFRSAQVAFANLINRISGKGTWELNPYVFAYTFELVK